MGKIFGDEAVAAAMIDRLVHQRSSSVDGRRYRLRGKDLDSPPPMD